MISCHLENKLNKIFEPLNSQSSKANDSLGEVDGIDWLVLTSSKLPLSMSQMMNSIFVRQRLENFLTRSYFISAKYDGKGVKDYSSNLIYLDVLSNSLLSPLGNLRKEKYLTSVNFKNTMSNSNTNRWENLGPDCSNRYSKAGSPLSSYNLDTIKPFQPAPEIDDSDCAEIQKTLESSNQILYFSGRDEINNKNNKPDSSNKTNKVSVVLPLSKSARRMAKSSSCNNLNQEALSKNKKKKNVDRYMRTLKSDDTSCISTFADLLVSSNVPDRETRQCDDEPSNFNKLMNRTKTILTREKMKKGDKSIFPRFTEPSSSSETCISYNSFSPMATMMSHTFHPSGNTAVRVCSAKAIKPSLQSRVINDKIEIYDCLLGDDYTDYRDRVGCLEKMIVDEKISLREMKETTKYLSGVSVLSELLRKRRTLKAGIQISTEYITENSDSSSFFKSGDSNFCSVTPPIRPDAPIGHLSEDFSFISNSQPSEQRPMCHHKSFSADLYHQM